MSDHRNRGERIRDGSHLAEILFSPEAGSNHRVNNSKYIISPDNSIYRAWKTFLLVFVIYTACMSPFEFGFIRKPNRSLSILDNFVNLQFAIDIVLTFFVAYLDKNTCLLVNNPKQIAWRYITSWFAFDVLSIVPSQLTLKIFPSPFNSFGLFNMLLRRPTFVFRAWEAFLLIFVIYTAWMSPFEFGFIREPNLSLSILDNCVNVLFAIDIVLTFFVAYLDENTCLLVNNRKQIAWRYITSWFALDVLSTVPSRLTLKIFPSPFKSFGFLNMLLRLWRLGRVNALFLRLEENRNFNYFWVRRVKLVSVALFAIHCAGCLYYFLAVCYHDPKNTWIGALTENLLQESLWVQYVTSVYWSAATLTTLGYLQPKNTGEMIFGIFYMLFNLWLAAYLTVNMTNLVLHGANRTQKFRDAVQAISNCDHRHPLPRHLLDEMRTYVFLTNSKELQDILKSFPKPVRSEILNYLFGPLVDAVYLFQHVSSSLRSQLVSEMKTEYFPLLGNVTLQNEAPTDFYIVVSGALVIISNDEEGCEQIVGEAKRGDVCGELGVLCGRSQLFTMRAKRSSLLLRLNRDTFFNIIQGNVEDGTIIISNLLQHLKDKNDMLMKSTLLAIEHMPARGGIDLPLSVFFAAQIGDELLLELLLKRGLNPNVADSNGKTSLHIAASKGSESCVLLLLNYAADPNSRDVDGNVPLWEAILGGHDKIFKLLLENGANLSSDDVGRFSRVAAEKNNLNLLEEIVHHGGDVTCPNNTDGNTALHVVVAKC